MPQPDRVKSIFFGFSVDNYAQGRTPACAINASNLMVEVHKHANDNGLTYRLADVKGVNIEWRPKEEKGTFSHGNNPSVALNDNNVVVVMNDISKKLQYSIGTVRNNTIGFSFTGKEFPGTQPDAKDPSVAVNRAGMLLEVHEEGNDIYIRRGTLAGETATWPAKGTKLVDNGSRPFISVNNTGTIFVTFQRSNGIFSLIGTYNVNAPTGDISWGNPEGFENGERATVVVTDQNLVFITWTRDSKLFRINGAYVNSRFQVYTALRNTNRAFFFDDGTEPQIASNGSVAIQTHASGNDLLTNASLIFDRSSWMSDNRTKLITKSLKEIALPGSHDSGANTDNRARTQTFSILDQLFYGIRYFDIRPYYTGSRTTLPIDASKLVTYHQLDIAYYLSLTLDGVFEGQSLESIAGDVATFLDKHNELVIIRISQFKNFNQDVFAALVKLINDKGLAPYFYLPGTTVTGRLAERKLDQFLKLTKGTVLIIVDTDGDTDYLGTARNSSGALTRPVGFFRYRDWFNPAPEVGDITVFDLFSDTNDFDTMATSEGKDTKHPELPGSTDFVKRGQIPKFRWFDGLCEGKVGGGSRSTTPCDLFLFSWQVTPTAPTFQGSPLSNAETPNKNLVGYLARPENAGPNANGKDINLIYNDGVESSRSPDVAMVRNKLP